jgi:hypothetical protein
LFSRLITGFAICLSLFLNTFGFDSLIFDAEVSV